MAINKKRLFTIGNQVVDDTHYMKYVSLISLLYHLSIIDKDAAIDIVLKFRPVLFF